MTNKPIFPKAKEIFLPNAPLISVLSQIRFESILSIQKQELIAPFQEAIREQYPILREEMGTSTVVNPTNGMYRTQEFKIYRFMDLEEKWKVTLASDWIAIECNAYKNSQEFHDKYEFVLRAFTETLRPGIKTRTGIRFIDRLTGDDLANIKEFVRPELVGLITSNIDKALIASTGEMLVNLDPYRLFARYGLLPSGGTIDPQQIKPVNTPSWVLDIDVSKTAREVWKMSELSKEIREAACLSYDFFRWAVTDKLIVNCGGNT